MDVIRFIIWVAVAYFIGNISPSIILGKLRGVDIKKGGQRKRRDNQRSACAG